MIIPKALLMTFIASIFIFSMANISYQQVELPFTDDVEGDGGEEEEAAQKKETEERRRATEEEGDGGEEGAIGACIRLRRGRKYHCH